MSGSDRHTRRWLLQALVIIYGSECCRCGKLVDITISGARPEGATIDHLNPLADQGSDDLGNLRLAHFRCNSRHGGSMNGTRRAVAATYGRAGATKSGRTWRAPAAGQEALW